MIAMIRFDESNRMKAQPPIRLPLSRADHRKIRAGRSPYFLAKLERDFLLA